MMESQRFPNAPESVAATRRFAGRVLRGLGPQTLDQVRLMVSELATNCVRHTGSGYEVSITWDSEEIVVEVADDGGGEPELLSPGPTEPHGRGLLIVDALSSDWGVRERKDPGKTVWFSIPRAEPAHRLACT